MQASTVKITFIDGSSKIYDVKGNGHAANLIRKISQGARFSRAIVPYGREDDPAAGLKFSADLPPSEFGARLRSLRYGS